MNIYVGNLPYSVKSEELRETFEAYGEVGSAEVIIDRRSKRSRGYGFVEMPNDDEAREAIESMNGADYQGRELRVDESLPRDQKESKRGNQSRRQNNRSSGGRENNQATSESAGGGGLFGFVKKIFG